MTGVIHKELLDAVAPLCLQGEIPWEWGSSSSNPVSQIYVYLLVESVREKRDYWASMHARYARGEVYDCVCGLNVPVTREEVLSWCR